MNQKPTQSDIAQSNQAIDQSILSRVIGFGKYSGRKIREIPHDYIVWYTDNHSDNGYNNDLRRYGHKIKDQWEKDRSKATKIPIEFEDNRYQYGNQQTHFFLSNEFFVRAMVGGSKLEDVGAYMTSFKVPNHMLLAGGVMPSFKYDLFLQMSRTGYTVLLVNHSKKEMYVSKKQVFQP